MYDSWNIPRSFFRTVFDYLYTYDIPNFIHVLHLKDKGQPLRSSFDNLQVIPSHKYVFNI